MKLSSKIKKWRQDFESLRLSIDVLNNPRLTAELLDSFGRMATDLEDTMLILQGKEPTNMIPTNMAEPNDGPPCWICGGDHKAENCDAYKPEELKKKDDKDEPED